MRIWSGLLLLCAIFAGMPIFANGDFPAAPRASGPSPEVMEYQHPAMEEIYRLRIVNDADGAVTGWRTGGTQWEELGRVLRYTEQVSTRGYTASKWAPLSAVAATAVNAIHIRTGYNAEDDKGVVFSILPRELTQVDRNQMRSYLSPDSSIYTDIPGGAKIFGGHWAPYLGNPVYRETPHGLELLPENYTPRKGDIFIIPVMRPTNMPASIVFENRFGGYITAVNFDGSTKVIGQVLKPVAGVGRFTGTQYADIGRLRANHNGVIDISVSPHGRIGGFQILPREHGMSPEMHRARTMTQWMVVGPLDARAPSWEGVAPLFLNYLAPAYNPDDWSAPDWLRRITSRVIVDVRRDNGQWEPMPTFVFDPDLRKPLPDWANTALQEITHIRIHLPVPDNLPPISRGKADAATMGENE